MVALQRVCRSLSESPEIVLYPAEEFLSLGEIIHRSSLVPGPIFLEEK
jgi:hypothetical protein